ncbi:hypothetical protein MKW98_018130, partial [Papaver atlanticum]
RGCFVPETNPDALFIAYRIVEIVLSYGIIRLLIEIKMGMRQKRSMQPLLILNSITFQQHESIL